jgi:putative radical SAM enzyme (TIGR03279 family)
MRDTLYFKDDDSRLSFLMGNYITLTNMNSDDIDRIIRYRMSPINVSVHTTNKDLRVFMLKNKSAGDILKKIEMLTDGGITVNCQIVLCRGINDSSELDKSIEDLAFLYPGINSISVVPVGITQHREGLYSLKPFDKATAKQVVKQINGWQKKLLKRYGSKIVYIADEFYLMAEEEIPQFEHYDDFPQIENGVGLIAMFKKEFFEYLEGIRSIDNIQVRNVSIATGSAAFKFIKYLAETLEKRYGNISVNVYEIKNNFFGENVTVTGLLTGTDIAAQLEGKPLGDNLLLCKSMLKSGEKLFLDDYTIEELERYLNVKIQLVENSGSDFIEKITGQLTEGQLTEDGYDVGAGSPRPCQ